MASEQNDHSDPVELALAKNHRLYRARERTQELLLGRPHIDLAWDVGGLAVFPGLSNFDVTHDVSSFRKHHCVQYK